MKIEDIDALIIWNISQNHTGLWGAIKGRSSMTYRFQHEDREEVLKWLVENYKL